MSSGPLFRIEHTFARPGHVDKTQAKSAQTAVAREVESGRTGRGGWRHANEARKRQGRKKALRMLSLRISGCSGHEIAELFGTTRSAVLQRLYRLRSGHL